MSLGLCLSLAPASWALGTLALPRSLSSSFDENILHLYLSIIMLCSLWPLCPSSLHFIYGFLIWFIVWTHWNSKMNIIVFIEWLKAPNCSLAVHWFWEVRPIFNFQIRLYILILLTMTFVKSHTAEIQVENIL